MGSDKDSNLLVGTNPVGIIWSEYGEIDPVMRQRALPILRANKGWEAIIMTPRGRNHAYKTYMQVRESPQWHTSFLPITATRKPDGQPVVTAQDVQDDIEAGMDREAADQEYYLSWDAPMPGAYYAEEMRKIEQEGRIGHIPYDPTLPVCTAWNLGHDEANAIWFFQLAGGEVRFIDYETGNNRALGYLNDPIRKGWIDIVYSKPYIYDHNRVEPPLTRDFYEIHYGPHDLEVHEYSSGKTRYGFALEYGQAKYKHPFRFSVLPRGRVSSEGSHDADGIAAARSLLGRSVFDAEACVKGLDALSSYRREWDGVKQVFQNHPLRDWAHSGADAFRYAAIGIGVAPTPLPPKVPEGSFADLAGKLDRYKRTGRWPGHASFGGRR